MLNDVASKGYSGLFVKQFWWALSLFTMSLINGMSIDCGKGKNMQSHGTVSFKKLTKEDVPLLAKWFSYSHVNRWWPTLEQDEGIDHFLKRIRSKDTFGFIVYRDDKPVGYIQYYYIDPKSEKTGKYLPELLPNSVGTDQFIGEPDLISKGLGTKMITLFIEHLRKIEPQVATIIVDPDPANAAAIRCYEKVGFKKILVYDTSYGPCLLMKYDL